MNKPTVGRQVHFFANGDLNQFFGVKQALAATIAFVHSQNLVNLQVIDGNGQAKPLTSVQLLNDGASADDAPPIGSGYYAAWPGYEQRDQNEDVNAAIDAVQNPEHTGAKISNAYGELQAGGAASTHVEHDAGMTTIKEEPALGLGGPEHAPLGTSAIPAGSEFSRDGSQVLSDADSQAEEVLKDQIGETAGLNIAEGINGTTIPSGDIDPASAQPKPFGEQPADNVEHVTDPASREEPFGVDTDTTDKTAE